MRLRFRTASDVISRLMVAVATIFAVALVTAASPMHAQSYSVIYTFTNGPDGSSPANLAINAGRAIYGVAYGGGVNGGGTVFSLKPLGSGWAVTALYGFGADGTAAPVTINIGIDGTLYGNTRGVVPGCCGTVFRLLPPLDVRNTALWSKKELYRFAQSNTIPDGELAFDSLGNIYGTVREGGNQGYGFVYELTHSGGVWTETQLYSSVNLQYPVGGAILGNDGSLYGVFAGGGRFGYGAVYKLLSGMPWTEQSLHDFTNGSDGGSPEGGLISDNLGGFYGTTASGGNGGGGTVFRLTPQNGGWQFDTLYSFSGIAGPQERLVMDSAGNLYGTTYSDGANGMGAVFKLTPSGQTWVYKSLHDFTGGTDGAFPLSNIIIDANDNLYGTTSQGGNAPKCNVGCGVVFKISPHAN
jgi:uncharacterized repeat protein (TIGR03803 family)